MITITIHKRHVYALGALIVVLAVIVPSISWASHTFTDVPDDNTFHDDIAWLAATGITKGCNPPANTEFCPEDPVTRQTLAAFLRRLAEAGVVDAATAESAASAMTAKSAETAETASSADTAGDADTLDGKDSSAFAPANLIGTSILAVSVRADGTIINSATEGPVSAVRTAPGSYTVTFDRPVDHCIAATNDVVYGENNDVSADVTFAADAFDSPEDVIVLVRDWEQQNYVDTEWSMVLVCPDIAVLSGDRKPSVNLP